MSEADRSKERNSGRTVNRCPAPEERLIPPRGDCRTLISFQKAEVVYDITFRFAHKYLSRGDRTLDQQLIRLEEDFVKDGGLRERMTRARMASRNGKYGSNGNNPPDRR